MTVIELPSIPIVISSWIFESSIIAFEKTSVLFENGSDIGQYQYLPNTIISSSLLPIGDWELIENMYPNPGNISYSDFGTRNTFASKYYDNHFILEFYGFSADSSNGWSANISLDTGVPNRIQFWQYKIFSDNVTIVQPEYHIVLELILELE